MGKISTEERNKKIAQGKQMFIKGFDLDTIAEILGMAITTVKKWADIGDWEQARQSQFIALSELRNTILESFISLKSGIKPMIKPDEAAKYASAFEKLSDKKKSLSHMYESFELLTEELMRDVQKAKSKKDKETALEILKIVRTKTDHILTKITSETLNDN